MRGWNQYALDMCPCKCGSMLTEGKSTLNSRLVGCSFHCSHFGTIPMLRLNRRTSADEEYTHGMPDLMMWFAVLVTAKSARGRVLRMWAVKGHLDWSVLISLI